MTLSKEQIKFLLSVVADTSDDCLSCDDCFGYVAQFVEAQLSGVGLCESMKLVQAHLSNCPCCRNEFEALLKALCEAGDCPEC